MTNSWYVYILVCSDRSLYTGITTDLARRITEHNSPSGGARYTRSRQPVTLVYSEYHPSRSEASKREYRIKKMSVTAKKKLIATNNSQRL